MTCKSDDSIKTLTHEGETFLQVGNYDKAIDCFTAVIEKKPSAWVYAHRGEAYRLQASFNNALDDFEKAIELSGGANSKYAWAYAHKGETLRVMGGPSKKKALTDFTRAVEINPKYAWAYAHRGGSHDLYNQSELEPALEDFDKAILLYPKYAWAFAFRSAVYLFLGEGDRAYYDLLHAISLDNTIVRDPIIRQLKGSLRNRIAENKNNSKIKTPLPD
ncbi:tetratricopeptide repeat protein [Kamptonema formosum]|uniref:tetratricopeptide repeat protein n=1 Tax=Kamptonema formosum TaxID=331992 RepID=UPI0003654F8F|nr:hypothetical protein [Oscillatoria sp. PCC 10802]